MRKAAITTQKRFVVLGDVLEPDRNGFGVVRLAMALAVLFSHSYLFLSGTSATEPLHALTGHSLGEHAVQVFFFLSGVLVAQSLARSHGVADFVVARVLRIFPGLAVCVALTALVMGPIVSALAPMGYLTHPGVPAYVARTLSLSTGSAPLPGVFETVPLAGLVNMSLWTLKYEVLCYAGLALAAAAGLARPGLQRYAAPLLALFVTLVFISPPKAIETYSSTDNVRYFALFFGTGVLAYLVRDRLPITALALLPLFALFLAALGTRFGELAAALFLGYATLWVGTLPWGALRDVTNRHDLSFGVYIYAGPIQQLMIDGGLTRDPLLLSLAALTIVMPLAYFSWTLVEAPALALRRRIAALFTPMRGLFPD